MENTPNFLNNQPQETQPQVPVQPEPMSPKKSWRGFIIVLIIVAIVGGGAYLYASYMAKQNYDKVTDEAEKAKQEVKRPELQSEEFNSTDTWQTHKNYKYGVEIQYPSTWLVVDTVKEFGPTGEFFTAVRSPDGRLTVAIDHNGTYDDGVYLNATESDRRLIDQILSTFRFIE